jgi:hypothetical protein
MQGTGGAAGEGGMPGTGGSSGAGAWTPQSMSGLVLWLDGSQGVETDSGIVVHWADQSGHGNDALLPPIAGGTPVLAAAAFGGKPAVRFNGTTDYLVVNDDVSLQFGTGDFAVAVATRHTTSPDVGWGVGFFYAKPAAGSILSNGPMLYGNTVEHTTEAVAQLAGQQVVVKTAQSGLNDGAPMVLVMRRAAHPGGPVATLSIRLNGAEAGSMTGMGFMLDASAIGQPLYIGGSPDMHNIMGDIAEVIAVKGPSSVEHISAIEMYLMTKYGF